MTPDVSAAAPPWLAIVGIGEDGADALAPAATRAIAQARLVVGGARHLALARACIATGAVTLVWPQPLADAFPAILARRGTPVAVLASGDPFHFGVGSLVAAHVPPQEFICHPAPSAFSLAAARLGWALQDCALVTLHGRPLETLLPHLQPGRRVLALAWDGTTAGKVAAMLVARGFGRSRMAVLAAMAGPRESMRSGIVADWLWNDGDPLATIALDIAADAGVRVLPLAPGLPDDWFAHDGQLTKRIVRAATLAALAPRKGELLWDIGAGSGSIGIEWMLRDPAMRAIAIEHDATRAARARENAARLGVPGLVVMEGRAPAALAGLAAPDAIFIGGGASDAGLLDAAVAASRGGGRLVVNAVTLEGQAELSRRYRTLGGDLATLSVAHADPVGAMHGWRAAMPVVQWAWVKPRNRVKQ